MLGCRRLLLRHGQYRRSGLLTVFVLAGNTLLRPLVNMINRIPIDDRATEATYEVSIISSREAMPQLRDLLVERLEAAKYPVSDVVIVDRSDETVEIVATLVSTAVHPHEIEAVTTFLEKQAPSSTRAGTAVRRPDVQRRQP